MGLVIRKFITDVDAIYSVSNGVIIKESVNQFIKQNKYWYNTICNTGNTVGWNDKDTVLMVTDYDRIYRISSTCYKDLLDSGRAQIIGEERPGVVTIRYDVDLFDNESLEASDDYKSDFILNVGRFTIVRLNDLEADDNGVHDRVLSYDKSNVYTIDENVLVLVKTDDCFWAYRKQWRDYIDEDEVHRGCIDMTDSALFISADKIEYVDATTALEILNDKDTRVTKVSYGDVSYTKVRYFDTSFTEEQINATIHYKCKE